ncbi:MAG: EAL domain-containing protein [Desulfovibrionaceae bacterium]
MAAGLLRVGIVVNMAAILLAVIMYLSIAAWQFLALAAGLGIASACLVPARWGMAAAHTERAGMWLVLALALDFIAGALFLTGAVTIHTLGGIGLAGICCVLVMPGCWRVWTPLLGVYAAVLIGLERYPLLPRYDVATLLPPVAYMAMLAFIFLSGMGFVAIRAWRTAGSIRFRLLTAFVAVVLLPSLITIATLLVVDRQSVRAFAESKLETMASLREQEIAAWMRELRDGVHGMVQDESVQALMQRLLEQAAKSQKPFGQDRDAMLLRVALQRSPQFKSVELLDVGGWIVVSLSPSMEGEFSGYAPYLRQAVSSKDVVVALQSRAGDDSSGVVLAFCIRDKEGEPLGVLVARMSLQGLDALLLSHDASVPVRTVLVDTDLLQVRSDSDVHDAVRVFVDSLASRAAVVDHVNGAAIYEDHRGVPVVGVWRWLPELKVGLLVEEDQASAFASTTASLRINVGVTLAALLLAVLAALYITRSIAAPLAELAATATRAAGGDLYVEARVGHDDEVGALAVAFNAMVARSRELIADLEQRVEALKEAELTLTNYTFELENQITERQRVEERLQYQAFHDPLTGLANRAMLLERLERAAERGKRRTNYLYAVLFIDMDRFKVVNDSLGHSMGDKMLVEASLRIKISVRTLDTVCRLGGDEFVVLLEEIQSPREAVQIAKRIKDSIRSPFFLGGHEVHTTASIGVLLNGNEYDSPEELLRDVNIAMHHAKELGRDKVKVFQSSMREAAVRAMLIEGDLRKAVLNDEFFIVYQPILNLKTRTLSGFEALVRWQHPERGLVYPADFIHIAEDSGLIVPMGEKIIRRGCKRMAEWKRTYPEQAKNLTLAINLSARQFVHEDLRDVVYDAIQASGVDPASLTMEITESVVMENAEKAIMTLKQLKKLGIKVSVDDFGTGYSSLSYLQRFPLDILKIDRSFIMRMEEDPESREIVRAILSLSHALSLRVVAEGVSTEYHLEILDDLGCQYVQGFFFSKPLNHMEAEKWVSGEIKPPL